MNNIEITDALAKLQGYTRSLEEAYEENGGEVTEETLHMEQEREVLAELLCTEGVDYLGRWLKSKEDEAKTIKAEADYVTRRRKAVENSVEYVKGRIAEVMQATHKDKIKGSNGYSFTASRSITTTVDSAAVKELYLEKAKKALLDAGIPAYITVKLDASVSAVPEGEPLPEIFTRTDVPSVTFRKPKASKE